MGEASGTREGQVGPPGPQSAAQVPPSRWKSMENPWENPWNMLLLYGKKIM